MQEDLGYSKKKKKAEENPYRYFEVPKKIERLSPEVIAERKQRNLDKLAIWKQKAEAIEEVGICLKLKMYNSWLYFWCASDTYFIEAKNEYGCGIESLLESFEDTK